MFSMLAWLRAINSNHQRQLSGMQPSKTIKWYLKEELQYLQ